MIIHIDNYIPRMIFSTITLSGNVIFICYNQTLFVLFYLILYFSVNRYVGTGLPGLN